VLVDRLPLLPPPLSKWITSKTINFGCFTVIVFYYTHGLIAVGDNKEKKQKVKKKKKNTRTHKKRKINKKEKEEIEKE